MLQTKVTHAEIQPNKQKNTVVIPLCFHDQAVLVLNHLLSILARSHSGHTAAALLDQWRAITLGGGEGGADESAAAAVVSTTVPGEEDGDEAARSMSRHGRPTEVRTYMVLVRTFFSKRVVGSHLCPTF